jgi:hypothetical protein
VKYHIAAALKGSFDSSFSDLGEDGDRFPGRALGELVAQGLQGHGLQASGPFNEEPFFVVTCWSGAIECRILCYLLEPGKDPVWVVECARTLGLIAKWRGKSEEQELGTVVTAIHETLKNDSRVSEIRWFSELPALPFERSTYHTSPWSVS